MTHLEIENEIKNNEGLLEQYIEDKKKLEIDVEELNSLNLKLLELQNNFNSKQATRKNALSNLMNSSNSLKSIQNYCSGMEELLNGSEFTNADDGLTTSQKIVCGKIDSIQIEIEELRLKIETLNETNRTLNIKRQTTVE